MQEKRISYLEPSLEKERRGGVIEDLVHRGKIRYKLCPPFDGGENLHLLELLVLGPWIPPNERLGNAIFARGTSQNAVEFPGSLSGFSIVLPLDERVDLVVKQVVKTQKAEIEIDNLRKIMLEKRIRVGKPVGYLTYCFNKPEETVVLTVLEKGVIPLQNLRIENMQVEDQKSLLRILGDAIAVMHNSGVFHGDLHLGNVAFDPNFLEREDVQDYPVPQIVFFDFAKAQVPPAAIRNNPERSKMKSAKDSTSKAERWEEAAIKDLARLFVYLTGYSAKLKRDFVFDNLVLSYCKQRSSFRQSICSREDYMRRFWAETEHIRKTDAGRVQFFLSKRLEAQGDLKLTPHTVEESAISKTLKHLGFPIRRI